VGHLFGGNEVPLFCSLIVSEQMEQGDDSQKNGFKSRGRASLPWHISKVKIAPKSWSWNGKVLTGSKIYPSRMINNARCGQLQLDKQALR